MKIKNIENLKAQIRPHLKDYLEEMGADFDEAEKFTCPNKKDKAHPRGDREPSASFYPNTESWKCFVCNAFGDVFAAAHYLESKPIEGPGFITDNILYLAKKYKVPYKIMEQTPKEKAQDVLFKVLDMTNKMLKLALKSNNPKVEEVKAYVRKRGWTNIVDTFELGYCSYDKLIANLKTKNFSNKTLEAAGLTGSTSDYSCKKLFDNRLIFPIKNHYGRIVAFASRRIDDSDTKKYLNFGNTTLYSKSKLLYNLDKARVYSSLYIVEGYADVFTMYKHGIKNVVALCGLGFDKGQYKLLVSQGIRKIVFCLNSDEAGVEAMNRIIDKELKNKVDLSAYIKELPKEFKDVDELLNSNGREAFDTLPEYSVFDWKLQKLVSEDPDEFLKNDLINLIVLEQDYTEKELLIKKLADKLEIDFNAVRREVERNEKYGSGRYLITSGDVLEEQNSFEKELNSWEQIVWTRKRELLGLPVADMPIMTKMFDGIQNMLYLIAADTNVGKSATLLNLAEGLLKANDDIFILLFSIDDNVSQMIPRMAALKSEIQINTVSNPKFKIEKNNGLTSDEINRLLRLREATMEEMRRRSSRFAIKDQSDIRNLEQMEKYIRIYKSIATGKQLIVMVDNIHRIKIGKKLNTSTEQFIHLSNTLKDWKDSYQIPVVVTAEIKKIHEVRKPRADDIREAKNLQYDSDVTVLLYTDFYKETGKVKLEHFDGDGYGKPVVEFKVIKNKTSGFKGNLYYKLFPEYSKLVECTREEMDKFRHPERKK